MLYLAKNMCDQEDKTTDFTLYDTVTRLSRIILNNIDKTNAYIGRSDNKYQSHLVSGLSDEVLVIMVGSVCQVVNQANSDLPFNYPCIDDAFLQVPFKWGELAKADDVLYQALIKVFHEAVNRRSYV